MKKFLSIFLVMSFLVTCNANENKQSRLNKWKEKTASFITENKKTTGAISVAIVAIPTGGYYVSYRTKNKAVAQNPVQTTQNDQQLTEDGLIENQNNEKELAKTIIKEVVDKVLADQEEKLEIVAIEEVTNVREALNSGTEILDLDPEVLSLSELNLSKRIYNLLINSGITTIEELNKTSAEYLLEIRGIGEKSLEAIDEALDSFY